MAPGPIRQSIPYSGYAMPRKYADFNELAVFLNNPHIEHSREIVKKVLNYTARDSKAKTMYSMKNAPVNLKKMPP